MATDRFNISRLALLLALIASPVLGEPARPPYPTAHDVPLDPEERLVARADDHLQLWVRFNGIEGDSVPAFLYLPFGGTGQRPAVLLQYGSGGSKKTHYIMAIAKRFVARGFIVLTIDIPNKGERRREDAAPFQRPILQTMGDYSRAVDYLVTRPEVDRERIAYMGISWGAITGITFVAHDPRVKAMVSLVGGGNFIGWLRGEIAPEAKAAAEAWDPVYHVARITPRPLLLLNVTKDQLVPRFFAESLHKAAGEGAEKLWLETDHFFNGLDRDALADRLVKWLQEKLEAR